MAILTNSNASVSGTFSSSAWSNLEEGPSSGITAVTRDSVGGGEDFSEASSLTNDAQTKRWSSKRLWIKNVGLIMTVLAGVSLTGSLSAASPRHFGTSYGSNQQEWHALRSRPSNVLTETSDYRGSDLSTPSLLEGVDSFGTSRPQPLSQTGAAALAVSRARGNGIVLAGYSEYPFADEVIGVPNMQDITTQQGPKYPAFVMAEYRALAKKRSEAGLAVREDRRFAELKAQINAIDSADQITRQSVQSIKQVRKGLVGIRKALEKELVIRASST